MVSGVSELGRPISHVKCFLLLDFYNDTYMDLNRALYQFLTDSLSRVVSIEFKFNRKCNANTLE